MPRTIHQENWKAVFCEMEKPGGFAVWSTQFTCLRIPKLYNLRMDPCERADAYLHGWLTMHRGGIPADLRRLPPSQEPASFTIEHIARDVERRIKERAGKK